MKQHTQVLDFFQQPETYSWRGFCYHDLFNWSDDTLEVKHDYIQWYFPLSVPSQFHPDAPVASADEFNTIRNTSVLRKRQLAAFERVLKFYGLRRKIFGGITERKNFLERLPVWADLRGGMNHNYLRITRVLESTYRCGNMRPAVDLKAYLLELHENKRVAFPEKTIHFWRQAC